MAQAMQDLMAQAAAWMASYRHWLGEQGLGFSGDDLVAIQQAATTTPTPPGTEPTRHFLLPLWPMQHVHEQAMSTVYPLGGIPPEDPRLAPVEGIPLVAVAIGASAIGFATDPTLVARAAGAPRLPRRPLAGRAASTWGTRVAGDMVLGVLYGQLIVQATPLPERPAGRPGAGNLMA